MRIKALLLAVFTTTVAAEDLSPIKVITVFGMAENQSNGCVMEIKINNDLTKSCKDFSDNKPRRDLATKWMMNNLSKFSTDEMETVVGLATKINDNEAYIIEWIRSH